MGPCKELTTMVGKAKHQGPGRLLCKHPSSEFTVFLGKWRSQTPRSMRGLISCKTGNTLQHYRIVARSCYLLHPHHHCTHLAVCCCNLHQITCPRRQTLLNGQHHPLQVAREENVSRGHKNDLPPRILTDHWLIAAPVASICAPRYHFQPLNLSSLTLTAPVHNVDTLTQLFS